MTMEITYQKQDNSHLLIIAHTKVEKEAQSLNMRGMWYFKKDVNI